MCFTRGKTVANSLVRARLPGVVAPPKSNAQIYLRSLPSFKAHSVPCGTPGCLCCKAMSKRAVIHSWGGKAFHTPSGTSCDSSGVIYLLTCEKCKNRNQYIGETLRPLKTRIAGHRNSWESKNMPIYRHLRSNNHATFNSLSVTVLEVVKRPTKSLLLQREQHWISTLNTKLPYGLNSKFPSRQEID